MIKSATIPIPSQDLSVLQNDFEKERIEIINNLYNSLNENTLRTLLSDFCTEERESFNDDPQVFEIYFDDQSNDSGLIDVSFTGSAYFGCKNMDKLYEYDESIGFSVDFVSSTITFSTNPPDPFERYPDDEL